MSTWTGMHGHTGRRIDDVDHIRQSITDILTTPVGSRLKRRTYGSLLPSLIDQPASPANRLRLIAATFMAVIQWEPRVSLSQAAVQVAADGRVSVEIAAQRTSGPRAGSAINLNIPIQ